jgi:hypothetical protein
VLGDEAQRRELLDQLAVEARLGVVVELCERLLAGEAREAQPALEPALLCCFDLDCEQPLEEARVGGLVALGVLERAGELLGRGTEAQVGEMGAQLLVDALLFHRAAARAA